MKILTLCGSLRRQSINGALLHALAGLAPDEVQIRHFEGMAQLPLFNPDLEQDHPIAVSQLHHAIAVADLLIIASPEYAHGVTGVIKNALDWCVGLEAFVAKPVVLLNARARSQFADAALREILSTMSARIIQAASTTIPLTSNSLTTEAILQAPEVVLALKRVWEALECFTLESPRYTN
ncbi:MAG: NAD(P)H-dependent oxidoreductase [Undibacterium sp.]|nr:NAD(P)H-dependent oxidoreductase [Undibacterium sp.]